MTDKSVYEPGEEVCGILRWGHHMRPDGFFRLNEFWAFVTDWQKELDRLTAEYIAESEQLKPIRDELKELYRIKSKLGPHIRPAKEQEAEKELKKPEDTDRARIFDRVLSMTVPIRFEGESLRRKDRQEKLNFVRSMIEGKECA